MVIYFLMGIANLASHTITCEVCNMRFRYFFQVLSSWALEIVYQVFGWPIVLFLQIYVLIRGKKE